MKITTIKKISPMLLLITACSGYLDVKPDKSMVVPATVKDLQGILDYTSRMNASYPVIQEAATDNVFLTEATWNGLTELPGKNAYVWDDGTFDDSELNEWSLCYVTVFNANVVLERLEKIAPVPPEKDRMQGEALFFRSFAFYQLAQLFAPPYEDATAVNTPGIPLRQSADISEPSVRASLQETYQRIITDLEKASQLLPDIPEYKTRPSHPAVLGLLARIYLSMGAYGKAGLYADSCLQYNNTLMDYNQLNMGASYPFARFNAEVVFHSSCLGRTALSATYGRVAPELYETYADGDLRKTGFFRSRAGYYSFKGGYDGTSTHFNGIATDEMLLIRAECRARAGEPDKALEDMDYLLEKRYSSNTYHRPDFTTVQEVLDFVLEERRKELLFRGLRWTDLRRLNKDSHYAKTVTRELNGITYTLEPNSSKYVFMIPQAVIRNNNMQQNPR